MANLKHSVPNKVILIGASTGGPSEIKKIISNLPTLNNTSIVIAQHMVKEFIPSFAKGLQKQTDNKVLLISDGLELVSSKIYVASGYASIYEKNNTIFFKHTQVAQSNAYNPDINIIFKSFTPYCSSINVLGVILTGIGDDGVEACKELSQNGAKIVTQSSDSAIVDGMPARARSAIKEIVIQDLNGIITMVKEYC